MPTNLFNIKDHYSATGSPKHSAPRKQTGVSDLLLDGLLLLIEVIEMRKK